MNKILYDLLERGEMLRSLEVREPDSDSQLCFYLLVTFDKVHTFSVSHLIHRILGNIKYINSCEFLHCCVVSTQLNMLLLLLLLLFLLQYIFDLFSTLVLKQFPRPTIIALARNMFLIPKKNFQTTNYNLQFCSHIIG